MILKTFTPKLRDVVADQPQFYLSSAGNGTLTFTAFLYNPSAEITGWELSIDDADYYDLPYTSDSISHTLSGLAAGKRFKLRLRPEIGGVPGTAAELQADTLPMILVHKPEITEIEAGVGEATIKWESPVETTDSYQWNYIPNFELAREAALSSPTKNSGVWSATVTGLENGVEQRFQVRGAYGDEKGPRSNHVAVTPLSLPEKPVLQLRAHDQFIEVNARTESGLVQSISHWDIQQDGGTWTKMNLVWTKYNADGTSEDIVVDDMTPEYARQSVLKYPPTHYVRDLTNGTSYTFKVRLVTNSGVSVESDPVTIAPQAFEPPTRVWDLTAVSGPNSVLVNWTPPYSHYSHHEIRGKAEGDADFGAWENADTNNSHVVSSGLTAGTTYMFEVRAVNPSANGPAELASAQVSNATAVTGFSQTLGAQTGTNYPKRNVFTSWAQPAAATGNVTYMYRTRHSNDGYYGAFKDSTTNSVDIEFYTGSSYAIQVGWADDNGNTGTIAEYSFSVPAIPAGE